MGFHTNRPHAGSAAAMRDAEGLVEIQVADITAKVTRPAKANHRVHVGAVDIDLTAGIMCDLANLSHRFLEHAMG